MNYFDMKKAWHSVKASSGPAETGVAIATMVGKGLANTAMYAVEIAPDVARSALKVQDRHAVEVLKNRDSTDAQCQAAADFREKYQEIKDRWPEHFKDK